MVSRSKLTASKTTDKLSGPSSSTICSSSFWNSAQASPRHTANFSPFVHSSVSPWAAFTGMLLLRPSKIAPTLLVASSPACCSKAMPSAICSPRRSLAVSSIPPHTAGALCSGLEPAHPCSSSSSVYACPKRNLTVTARPLEWPKATLQAPSSPKAKSPYASTGCSSATWSCLWLASTSWPTAHRVRLDRFVINKPPY